MSLSDLASIGAFISGIAVLVSFIFLTLQMRQSANNQRATVHTERTAMVQGFILSLVKEDSAEVTLRGNAADSSLTLLERQKYMFICVTVFWVFEELFYQHRDRMLDDIRWKSNVRRFRFYCQAPGWRATWRIYRPMFEDDFASWVDSLFTETPVAADPNAAFTAWGEFADQELTQAKLVLSAA